MCPGGEGKGVGAERRWLSGCRGDGPAQALDSHEDRCHLSGKELTEWLYLPFPLLQQGKPGILGSLGAPEMETGKLQG